MKNGDSTVRLNNFNGTPTVSYNLVIIQNTSKVVIDGKSYDGFYVSYNQHDIATYGDVTTALVLGQMQRFYILNGNHSEAYKKLEKAGFLKCMDYFKHNINLINKYSDLP